MNTCKTCTFWQTYTNQWNKSWTECEAADWLDKANPVVGDRLAYYADAADDQGLTAGVMTGPDFGCIKWSAK